MPKPEPGGRHDGSTAFALRQRWDAAVEGWRKYLHADDERQPAKLFLTIPRTPTPDNECTARMYCIDPPPAEKLRRELANEPGLQEFLLRAARLAGATDALTPVLKRHGESTEESKKLVKALQRRPGLPTKGDYDLAWRVQRQAEAVQQSIWNGAIPADDDLRERRDFWQDNLSRLKTRDGFERMDAAVQKILSTPRVPDRELALLNAFQRQCQREDLLLVLEPLQMAGGTDCVSACRRWKDLVCFGLRFFSLLSHGHGHEVVFFKHVESTRSMPPKRGAPVSPELEWVDLLRGVTESIRPLAEVAGFSAGDRVPISKMVQDLDAIRTGKAIDFKASVAGVELLVAEIMAKAERSRRSVLDRFHQLVIELRDGIARLLNLVGEQSLSHDLMLLDHYVQRVEHEDRAPGPGRSDHVEWCALTKSMCANLKEATVLWNQERGDPARSLRHDFVLKGRPDAKVAMLHENSYHGLVLVVTRVALEPESPGAVPQDALDEIGLGPMGRPIPGVVRLRMFREMLKSSWPREAARELEREHAQLLELVREGPVPGDPAAKRTSDPKGRVNVWRPSAHQQLVLDVLKRDGRLQTGVLWERISPKRVGLRAHQNAMRDLVDHDRVKTDGKGRATEYWLP